MARFFLVDHRSGQSSEMRFAEFIGLTKGTSIRSMAEGEGFIEIGLTGELNLRFEGAGANQTVSVFSTLNDGDIPSIRVQVSETEGTPSASEVETKIRSMRQLHALAVLAFGDRLNEAASLLNKDANADLEQLLDAANRLYLSSATEGSVFLTLVTKTKESFAALQGAIPMLFKESRGLVIDSAKAANEAAHLDNDKKRQELKYDEMNKAIDFVERVQKLDPDAKAAVLNMFAGQLGEGGKEALAPLLIEQEKKQGE